MHAILRRGRVGSIGLALLVGVLIGVAVGDLHDTPTRVTVGPAGAGSFSAPADTSSGPLPVAGSPAPATGASAAALPPPSTGASTVGGAAAGPASPSPAPAGQPSTAGVAAPSGIPDKEIRIGIAIPDISAFRYLGPAYDTGNIRQQWEAVEDGWRREGKLDVNGRHIRFIYRTHNIVRPEEARAACVGLVQDDKAFMVLGTEDFGAGGECVAHEFHTPLLTLDGLQDEVYQRSAPYFFSLALSEDGVLRNWVDWAHAGGRLRGKKIGLYYPKAIDTQVRRTVIAELTKLGYQPAVVIQQAQGSPNSPEGSPSEDVVAVQRFRQAGVDLAMLMVAKTNFLQQADAQGYHPTYIDSDYSFGTSDAAASTNSPSQFEGTEAFTGRRDGGINAGMPLTDKQSSCLANYERYAKRKVARSDSAEMHYIMTVCDEAEVAHLALEGAGPGLTANTFVAAMQRVRGVPLRRVPAVSFGPGRYQGVDRGRTVKWAGSCKCWKAIGDFTALWS